MRILPFLAVALPLLAGAPAVEARDVSRSGTVTGPRGQTGTFSGNYSRTPGEGATRSRAWTGPRGQTVTRNGSVTNNGNGSFTGGAVTTGPGGRSVTRSGTATVTP